MNDNAYNKHLHLFVEEAEKLLNNFENDLLEYEKSPEKELIESLFRIVHTLKGVSGMFGFNNISGLTHDFESIYDGIRNNKLDLSKDIFDVSFKLIDHTRKLLTDVDIKDNSNRKNHEEIKSIIKKIIQNNSKIERHPKKENNKHIAKSSDDLNPKTWFILFKKDNSLTKRAVNLSYIIQDLAALGSIKIIGDINSPETFPQSDVDYGGILLTTTASENDIEEVLMFISENVRISKLENFDLLGQEFKSQQSSKENVESIETSTKLEGIGEQRVIQEIKETGNKNEATTVSTVKKNHISHISVRTDKLDRLMFLVSELVTTKSELLLSLQNNNATNSLEAAKKIETLSKNFHDNAISIRLVPIKEMVLRFNRLIRDLSQKLEKKIELVVLGEDTELDKNVIDSITDPIMHLIRNSIDHGIELPEKRKDKGKKETGTIKLNAYQSGNDIYIEISDDGVGIDPTIIRNKALEKGVINQEAKPSTKELYDLIFLPGFSTAQSLTEVSGRGVGMDVVKRKIQGLQGEVEVISEVGTGTTFRIKLHQTIAIVETLLTQVDSRYFAVPLQEIESCTQELSAELYQDDNRRFSYNHDLVPFVSLREHFGIRAPSPVKEILLVINKNNIRYALSVDRIIGEYQAVIKPLGKLLKSQKYISGASILGDGNLAMILDTNQLITNKSITN